MTKKSKVKDDSDSESDFVDVPAKKPTRKSKKKSADLDDEPLAKSKKKPAKKATKKAAKKGKESDWSESSDDEKAKNSKTSAKTMDDGSIKITFDKPKTKVFSEFFEKVSKFPSFNFLIPLLARAKNHL